MSPAERKRRQRDRDLRIAQDVTKDVTKHVTLSETDEIRVDKIRSDTTTDNDPIRIWHQNIGIVTPILKDKIEDWEKEYSPEWVCKAIVTAVESSKGQPNANYVEAILRRWKAEGFGAGRKGGNGSKPDTKQWPEWCRDEDMWIDLENYRMNYRKWPDKVQDELGYPLHKKGISDDLINKHCQK